MLTFIKPEGFKPAEAAEITEDEFKACQDFVNGIPPKDFNHNVMPYSDEFGKPWREVADEVQPKERGQ